MVRQQAEEEVALRSEVASLPREEVMKMKEEHRPAGASNKYFHKIAGGSFSELLMHMLSFDTCVVADSVVICYRYAFIIIAL